MTSVERSICHIFQNCLMALYLSIVKVKDHTSVLHIFTNFAMVYNARVTRTCFLGSFKNILGFSFASVAFSLNKLSQIPYQIASNSFLITSLILFFFLLSLFCETLLPFQPHFSQSSSTMACWINVLLAAHSNLISWNNSSQ